MGFVLAALTYILSTIFAIAGMGAAGVLVPNYIALGIGVYTAIVLALSQNVADLAVVSALHTRRGLVEWRKVAIVAVPAIALVPLGVYIAINVPRLLVLIAFGLFLLFALHRLTATSKQVLGRGSKYAAMLGAAEGLIAGLIGMDAAPVALIAYSYIYNDPKRVSANTAATALIVSATALTTYLYALSHIGLGISPVTISLVSIAGALGGATGAKLVHVVKPIHVRYTMVAVLSIALIEIAAKIAKAGFIGVASAAILVASLIAILVSILVSARTVASVKPATRTTEETKATAERT